MKKRLLLLLALFSLLMCFGITKVYASDEGDNWIHYKGIATARVNVRLGPGEEYDKVTLEDKSNLQLTAQEEVIILDEAVAASGNVWYHIRVTRDGKEYEGYSTSTYLSKDENSAITPSPTPLPTPTPTPAPTATSAPTSQPTPTQPLVPSDNTTPNDKGGILKVILIVVIIGVVGLIGLMVFKLLGSRKANGTNTSRKIDFLKKINLGGTSNSNRKLPQIKKSDSERNVREDVRSEIYYRNSVDDEYTEGANASMKAESDEKRALREAIERLQEHDIVYHTIYGEGEVYDNSDVKLIEVRFGNDMRFLKKDQLVAKRELKIIDEEDQSIARRRNRRRNNRH
ncbi:MAG: SH3 domain-containing protein [Lachnospiraceae bacterium]|nr:SH3 domain-containing protein [Lachnospiraceae bacterium]